MIQLLAAAALLSARACAQQDRAIVTVNGEPITQGEVFERLWREAGPRTLDAMIDDLLLRQEAAARSIKVSDKEIEAAFERMSYERRHAAEPAPGIPAELGPALKAEIGSDLAVEKLLVGELGITVGGQELKDAFAAHKDELGLPELVHLQVIVAADEAAAEKLAGQIRNGADFSFLARKESLDRHAAENGGDWGFAAVPDLPPRLAEAVGAMKLGEVRAVQGPTDWYVIQILENRPAKAANFDEAKDELRHILVEQKISAGLPQYLQALRAKAQIVPQGP